MRLLLISIFVIFLVVLLTPNAFAVQYPVLIHGGVADNREMNFLPSVIEHSPEATIYVADNASSDDSVAFLSSTFPNVELILIEEKVNLAFRKKEEITPKENPIKLEKISE